jgi:6,7-dimethyl-8-ribityllumazine synthase
MEPEAIEPTDPAALPPAPAAREARALPPVPEELMLEPEAPAEAPTSEAAMPEEVEAPGDRVEQDPAPVEETGPPEDETAAMEQEPAPAVAAASAHTRSTRLMESAPAFEVKTPRLRPMSSTPARKPELDEEREVYNHGSVRSTGAGAGGCHVAIVQSDYNHEITDMMAEWAKRQGEKMEADITAHVHVPGVFDTPLAVQTLMRRDDVDAVVVLGCVVQGETGHDEVITHAVAAKLLQLALDHGKPLGFGVTGPRMTWAQAEARVGVGKQAMESAVAQWRLAQG